MVKTSATSKTPLASAARSDAGRSMFTSAAIGMSWQLAIIVLVPIIGGYKLDQKFGLMPWLTLVGLVVALAGSIVVIRRALAKMNDFNIAGKDDA